MSDLENLEPFTEGESVFEEENQEQMDPIVSEDKQDPAAAAAEEGAPETHVGPESKLQPKAAQSLGDEDFPALGASDAADQDVSAPTEEDFPALGGRDPDADAEAEEPVNGMNHVGEMEKEEAPVPEEAPEEVPEEADAGKQDEVVIQETPAPKEEEEVPEKVEAEEAVPEQPESESVQNGVQEIAAAPAEAESAPEPAEKAEEVEAEKPEVDAAADADSDEDGVVDGAVDSETVDDDELPELEETGVGEPEDGLSEEDKMYLNGDGDLDDGIVPLDIEDDPVPARGEKIELTELDKKYRRARMYLTLRTNGIGSLFFDGVTAEEEVEKEKVEKGEDSTETEKAAAPEEEPEQKAADAESPEVEETTDTAVAEAPVQEKKKEENEATSSKPAPKTMMEHFTDKAVRLLDEAAQEGHFLAQIRSWQHQFRLSRAKINSMDMDLLNRVSSHDKESFKANSNIPFRKEYLSTAHMATARSYAVHEEYKDFELAMHHFREAARLGDTHAVQRLGYVEFRIAQDHMEATPPNWPQAMKYLRLSAQHKFPQAHHVLMNVFIRGNEFVKADPAKVLKYATSGAELNVGSCHHILGEIHLEGGRYAEGFKNLLAAAKSNIPPAIQRINTFAMQGHPLALQTLREYQRWFMEQQSLAQQRERIERAVAAMRERQNQPEKKGEACARCEKPNAVLRCTSCRRVTYCDADCQKKHWRVHRVRCKQWAAEKKAKRQ